MKRRGPPVVVLSVSRRGVEFAPGFQGPGEGPASCGFAGYWFCPPPRHRKTWRLARL